MSKLQELEEKAKRKYKGQRVWCEECKAFKYCSQVRAFGKPSGGNIRYELELNDCPNKIHGTTRDFQILPEDHTDYDRIIIETSPFV